MSDLFDTLICWLLWILNSIPWAIIAAVNLMLKALAALVNAAISVLPNHSVDVPELGNDLLGAINFFLPVGPLVLEFGVLVVAWALYKAYRYLFRWVV